MGPDEDLFANVVEACERSQPRPRVLVLSFPHNPTTAVVDLDFMQRVVDFARERELVVVHDFAYADIAFDGHVPPSILQAEGAAEVAVELYTLTKSFSMAGWRVGFVLGNAEVVQALARLKSYLDYGTFQPIQIASIVAMNEAPEYPGRGLRGLPLAPRRALRRPRADRLAGGEAEGDDVRLGADPRAVPRRSARSSSPSSSRARRRSPSAPGSGSAPAATGTSASRSSRTSSGSARRSPGSGARCPSSRADPERGGGRPLVGRGRPNGPGRRE